MFLQTVDAADQCRLAGAGWATDDDALAALDCQIDIAQRMKGSVPLVDADEVDGDAVSEGAFAKRSTSLPPFAQRALHKSGITRHPVAKDEIEHSGKDIACGHDRRPTPPGSLIALFIASRKSVMPTMETRVVSMNRPMKLLSMPGSTIVSACGSTTRAIICEIVQSERHCAFVLSPAQRLQAAAHFFSHISGRK